MWHVLRQRPSVAVPPSMAHSWLLSRDCCRTASRARVSKFKDLIAQATRLQSEVTNQSRARRKRLEKLVKASAAQRALQEGPEAEAVERQLRDMRAVCAASTAISPSTGSLFVRLFLGRVNVRVLQEADRTRLRDE